MKPVIFIIALVAFMSLPLFTFSQIPISELPQPLPNQPENVGWNDKSLFDQEIAIIPPEDTLSHQGMPETFPLNAPYTYNKNFNEPVSIETDDFVPNYENELAIDNEGYWDYNIEPPKEVCKKKRVIKKYPPKCASLKYMNLYQIQFGAFKKQSYAKRLLRKLSNLTVKCHIVKGKRLFRVVSNFFIPKKYLSEWHNWTHHHGIAHYFLLTKLRNNQFNWLVVSQKIVNIDNQNMLSSDEANEEAYDENNEAIINE